MSSIQERIDEFGVTWFDGKKIDESEFCSAFIKDEAAKANMDDTITDSNNIIEFLSSEGYIRFNPDSTVSSKDLYTVYKIWCEDNALAPLTQKSFCSYLKQNENQYCIKYTNKVNIGRGKFVRGFTGIALLQ